MMMTGTSTTPIVRRGSSSINSNNSLIGLCLLVARVLFVLLLLLRLLRLPGPVVDFPRGKGIERGGPGLSVTGRWYWW